MGSPLDELRQIKKQVDQKKEAIKANQRLEKDHLANSTIQKKQKRDAQIKEINQKSKTLKAVFIACGFLIIALVMFFVVQFIFLSGSKKMDVKLMSDGFKTVSASDDSYLKLSTFTDKLIDTYRKKPKSSTIPWYHSLPTERRQRYKNFLDDHINMPGLSFKSIKTNKDGDMYQVIYESTDGNTLTIELVYNDDFKLRIVKIY